MTSCLGVRVRVSGNSAESKTKALDLSIRYGSSRGQWWRIDRTRIAVTSGPRLVAGICQAHVCIPSDNVIGVAKL